MNENTCVCCGEQIPEGIQVCWNCENDADKGAKIPSDAQIQLASDIANTLGIEFPMSSKDFTAYIYWRFIKDHIKEARSYWGENESDEFLYDMDWFSPLNQ